MPQLSPEHDRRGHARRLRGRGRADGLRLPSSASGVLVGLCYLPLVLVNLPLGIALWVPTTFLTGLPGLRHRLARGGPRDRARLARDAPQPRPRVRAARAARPAARWWPSSSSGWRSRCSGPRSPDMSFTRASALGGLRAHVHGAHDARPHPRRRSGLIAFVVHRRRHVLGRARADRRRQAAHARPAPCANDGRLRGGLDDPNYLAAGIVPSIAHGGGPGAGRAQRARPARARRDGRDPRARSRRPPSRAAGSSPRSWPRPPRWWWRSGAGSW